METGVVGMVEDTLEDMQEEGSMCEYMVCRRRSSMHARDTVHVGWAHLRPPHRPHRRGLCLGETEPTCWTPWRGGRPCPSPRRPLFPSRCSPAHCRLWGPQPSARQHATRRRRRRSCGTLGRCRRCRRGRFGARRWRPWYWKVLTVLTVRAVPEARRSCSSSEPLIKEKKPIRKGESPFSSQRW